jgi:hypothetical protein
VLRDERRKPPHAGGAALVLLRRVPPGPRGVRQPPRRHKENDCRGAWFRRCRELGLDTLRLPIVSGRAGTELIAESVPRVYCHSLTND